MGNNRYSKKNQRKRQARRFKFLPMRFIRFLIVLAVIALLIAVLYRTVVVNSAVGRFPDGVSIDGESLAGYSYDQAYLLLDQKRAEMLTTTINLIYNGQSWPFSLADIDCSVDINAPLESAWEYGHTGSWFDKYNDIAALKGEPVDVKLSLTYNKDKLYEIINGIKAQIDRAPVNSMPDIDIEGVVTVSPSSAGYSMDAEKLIYKLIESIESGRFEDMEIEVDVLNPTNVEADFDGKITTRVENYYTKIPSSMDSNRTKNIVTAFGYINGTVLAPNEIFSFNAVVGERSTARGFLPAVQYSDNETVDGVGGGVCQASTTLYGAAVMAGLEIIERHPHSMTVDYVSPSHDAAVLYGKKDLKFRNNTSSNLYIFTTVRSLGRNDRRACVRILGEEMTVRVEFDYEIIQDEIQPKNFITMKNTDETKGYPYPYYTTDVEYKELRKLGRRSRGIINYYDAETGAWLDRKLLAQDTYEPQDGYRWVGGVPPEQ